MVLPLKEPAFKLATLRVQNYRSIVDSGEIRVEPLQALVGANNAGKSNLLRAIDVLLSTSISGISERDFLDETSEVVITGSFCVPASKVAKVRRYLKDGRIFVQRRLTLERNPDTGKAKISSNHLGAVAQPSDWWLSPEGVIAEKGNRPDWRAVAEVGGLLSYIPNGAGPVNKSAYKAGVDLYLADHDVSYGEPEIIALSDPKELLTYLPALYLLPAITDYSSETDRRSSSTIFNRLMGILGDRILRSDTRYAELEAALRKISQLLNASVSEPSVEGSQVARLEILGAFETSLQQAVAKLMPTVSGVHIKVSLDNVRDLISRGVSLEVDDGVQTDVVSKGQGLQRCVVFGLLQVLMSIQRGNGYSELTESEHESSPIILAVEEPESNIHPQGRRMIFKVLREFARTDQVIYSTHEPEFVDVGKFHQIALVRKDNAADGTYVCQCDQSELKFRNEEKRFQLFSSFNLDWNRIFFARQVVLIEGEVDKIAIVAVGRAERIFDELPEEIDCTIVVAGNKDEIPKLQRVLNPFGVPYTVLLELDGLGEDAEKNREILELLGGNRCVKMPKRLEDVAGHQGHLGKKHYAVAYFSDPSNITDAMRDLVRQIFNVNQEKLSS